MSVEELLDVIEAAEARARSRRWWRRLVGVNPFVVALPSRVELLGQYGREVTDADGNVMVWFRLRQVRRMRQVITAAARAELMG